MDNYHVQNIDPKTKLCKKAFQIDSMITMSIVYQQTRKQSAEKVDYEGATAPKTLYP